MRGGVGGSNIFRNFAVRISAAHYGFLWQTSLCFFRIPNYYPHFFVRYETRSTLRIAYDGG